MTQNTQYKDFALIVFASFSPADRFNILTVNKAQPVTLQWHI